MENGANRAVDSVKLFVGQLPKQMSEQQLAEVFAEAGTVNEINIIKDKLTKQSRGACFLSLDQRGYVVILRTNKFIIILIWLVNRAARLDLCLCR